MKEKLKKRKLSESKLNSRNLIKEKNTWTVPLVRYSGPFLKSVREDLQQMYLGTKKFLTMQKALHLRYDKDML